MRLLDAICIGDEFERIWTISEDILAEFAKISGDFNPLHTNDDFARKKGFPGRVAYGNILGLMISELVGMGLGDENVMLISQRLDYKKPMFVGDVIVVTGVVSAISKTVKVVEMKLYFRNQEEVVVAKGSCSLKCL